MGGTAGTTPSTLGRCPQGALGRSDRNRQGHHRSCRGDPPAQCRPKTALSRPAPPPGTSSTTCSSLPLPRCASNSTSAGRSKPRRPCAPDCGPTPIAPPTPPRPPRTALHTLRRRIAGVGAEAADVERHLGRLVATAAPSTGSRLGCGIHHTATLFVAAGHNIDRLGSEAGRSPSRSGALGIVAVCSRLVVQTSVQGAPYGWRRGSRAARSA